MVLPDLLSTIGLVIAVITIMVSLIQLLVSFATKSIKQKTDAIEKNLEEQKKIAEQLQTKLNEEARKLESKLNEKIELSNRKLEAFHKERIIALQTLKEDLIQRLTNIADQTREFRLTHEQSIHEIKTTILKDTVTQDRLDRELKSAITKHILECEEKEQKRG